MYVGASTRDKGGGGSTVMEGDDKRETFGKPWKTNRRTQCISESIDSMLTEVKHDALDRMYDTMLFMNM